jgi:hypothetical protein
MPELSTTAVWRARLAIHWPALIVLLAALLAGVVLGNDYGMSWDEGRNADVGADALRAYLGSSAYYSDYSLADHGPAYFMIQSIGSAAISRILPGWTLPDGRHLMNYLTFLAGALCFYVLCLRWMRTGTAAMITAVLVTQPVLFGNAFVNQKDIPFVAFFMATLVTGLAAADRRPGKEREAASAPASDDHHLSVGFRRRLMEEWWSLSKPARIALVLIGLVALLLAADLLIVGAIHRYGQSLVVEAYNGHAPPAAQALFARMASRAGDTPLQLYLAKYDLYFSYIVWTLVAVMLLGCLMIASQALPSIGRAWGFSKNVFHQPALLASAVLLGMTICIRQVGGFVGVLVSLALLYRWRSRAFFPLVTYWLISLVITIGTWPYLWPDPYSRLIGSLILVADFPKHSTLFQGLKVASGSLPWNYFPTLSAIQLTETAVALIISGVGVVIWKLARKHEPVFQDSLLVLWVGVPLVALIFFGMPVYGFRHLLFILPPLFIVAGVALESMLTWLKRRWMQTVTMICVLLPGILAIVQLHPYEYIYYNSLVGGVNGAVGEYEIDRWCISYREAIEYTNQIAEPGAVVIVPQQVTQIVPFARPDLRLFDASRGVVDADLVLSCTWRDEGHWDASRFVPLYQVRRGNAILTEVWQHKSD